MAFRHFFIKALLLVAVIVAVCVTILVALDEFGLFRSSKGRTIGIYTSERTAKYFLSMRYIPDNFDGLLIGPSLSDQLDTREINTYKVYNLSLLGANAVELDILVQNVLKRKPPKVVIICLDPFLLRDAEVRDARMTPRIIWSAIGSNFMVEYYFKKIRKRLSGKKELFEYNSYGAASINELPVEMVGKLINDYASANKNDQTPFLINQNALDKLAHTIATVRLSGAKVYAYYYPHPEQVYSTSRYKYDLFRSRVSPMFRSDEVVIDFCSLKYKPFRENPANYVDAAHISRQGAAFIVQELNRELLQGLK